MESLFHTGPKPLVLPDAHPVAAHSSADTPWVAGDANNRAVNGHGTRDLRILETGVGSARNPLRRLDGANIKNQVIMAQRLSHQEEKNLHFILQRYRLLCNRVVEVARNLNCQVFLVTSALAEEGKSLTISNLAFALSGIENKRTLLIDLDLRRYSLHSLFGLSTFQDEEHFLKVDDWHRSLWSVRPGLDALLATSCVEYPDEMLHSNAVRRLLATAKEEYDYILIDSAPLLLAADTHVLLPIIDRALLVVRADVTPMACSQDALKILGDKAVGCILNDVKRMKYEAYYHGYYGT
jgi:protein-tyrosine kinase